MGSINNMLINKFINKFIYLSIILFINSSVLLGCGGGGASATLGPTIAQINYENARQTIQFSDGTSVTQEATGSVVSWAEDHVTKTTTYTFADGRTNPVVTTVAPTVTEPVLTPENYPVNWAESGVVIPPRVSSSLVTYADGFTATQDGSVDRPFFQNTLSLRSINDPSAFVTTSSSVYDLRWGVPDKNGPGRSAAFADGNANYLTLSGPLNLWGMTVSGQCFLGAFYGTCANGPTIRTPHDEVLSAWRQGWTGKGVSVMMEDFLKQAHGVTTTLLVNRYAIESAIYGFDLDGSSTQTPQNLDGTAANPGSSVKLGVVNASYVANLPQIIGSSGPWTATQLANAAAVYAPSAQGVINRFTGVQGIANFNYSDAVIVKAAGNDSLPADKEPLVKALAGNQVINPRLLVVGALTMAGFADSPATLASYSNTAGTDSAVAPRFLVASGTTPFFTGDLALNGVPIDATTSVDPNGFYLGNVGTSYAAPRVAGYAAILRQKFPNLNAEKSASILLDTARYDTLSCHTQLLGCDPAIYGKGEVSLSRALAPVGRLR